MTDTQQTQHIYKVVFHNQGQIYEVYARQIYQSDLYGFIEIEELVFGERSGVLVDPSEEKLKAEVLAICQELVHPSVTMETQLVEEGIPVAPLPFIPQRKTN